MVSVWHQFASLDFQRPLVFLVGMAAFLCLMVIWATVSRRHWFWRALGVWGAFGLLVPIQAWDPAWMFGLVFAVVILVLAGIRWFEGRGDAGEGSTCWRFTLRDLFLVLLIVALWLPVILEVMRAFRPHNWYGWLASSGAIAVVVLLATVRAHSQRRPMASRDWILLGAEFGFGLWLIGAYQHSWQAFVVWYAVAVVLGIVLLWRGRFGWEEILTTLILVGVIPLLAQGVLKAGYWTIRWGPLGSSAYKPAEKIGMLGLFAIELAWALIGILLLATNARLANPRQPWRSRAGIVGVVVSGVWAIGVAAIYVQLLTIRPVPVVPQFTAPVNHYDRIIEAVERAVALSPTGLSIAGVREANPKAADELEALCREIVPLLESPNYVPYDPEKANEYGWLANHHHALQMFPHILIHSCDGNERETAVDYAMAVLRLGDMQSRGGLESDNRIGVFMRRRALPVLVGIQDELSPAAMRRLIAVLQQSINDREDPEVSWRRRLAYTQYHWRGWVLNLERIFNERNARRRFIEHTLVPERRQELAKRLLQAELSVRLYSRERGELPERLSDVVPDYLAAVPVDLDGQPLKLRKEMDGKWGVHCAGWGGVHDGGSFFDTPNFPQAEGLGVDLEYLKRQQF